MGKKLDRFYQQEKRTNARLLYFYIPRLTYSQGDHIGRHFANQAVVYFVESYIVSSPICILIYFSEKKVTHSI
jgi:hypothetical protein